MAKTVGEALTEASEILGVRFDLDDGPMWFRVHGIPDYGDQFMLVDVSIDRDGETIYPMRPKRDAGFPILESDKVSIFVVTD